MLQSTNKYQQVERVVQLRPLDSFSGSLSQRTYLCLKSAILELAYPPGALIRKSTICETLGVSRSPVSEAIARLAAERLVKVVPQAGTYVSRFSISEIRESAFIREAIEVAAVNQLAPQITDDQLIELRRNLRIQEALVADGDGAGFYKLDSEFHGLLMSYTGYPRLAELAEVSWVQIYRARQQILPERGRVLATLGEHWAVVEALEVRDADRAEIALRKHLRQLVSFLVPLKRSRPELFDPE